MKLVKVGTKVVRHGRYLTFQPAGEVCPDGEKNDRMAFQTEAAH